MSETGWDTVLGCFDPYSLELSSVYSKEWTDRNVDGDVSDSVRAWRVMIHEWVHFMQFCSSTYGLLITWNRMRQQSAFTCLCLALKTLYDSRGQTPVLIVPLRKAITNGLYPSFVKDALIDFQGEWLGAEEKIMGINGMLGRDSRGARVFQRLSPLLVSRLGSALPYAMEPITVRHVVEPIAVGCEMHWLGKRIGREEAQRQIESYMPHDVPYSMLPFVETDLGINYHTRLILHDLALMLPVEKVTERKKATHQRYSPPSRLVASLDLVVSGKVAQASDSEAPSWLRMAREIGAVLDWPEPAELLANAIEAATLWKSVMGVAILSHVFDDFLRGFEARRKRADAFVCLTPENSALHNSGWQPTWRLPDGYAFPNSQDQEESMRRLMLTLAIEATRAFVLNGPWECPLAKQCAQHGPECHRFPGGGPYPEDCIGRYVVAMVTAGLGPACLAAAAD